MLRKTAITLGLVLLLAPGCTTKVSTGPSSGDSAPAARKAAPDFDLENIAGGTIKATDFKGKVAVVDFWATWCQPCIVEIPKFNELHDAYQGKDVEVIAVTIESEYDTIEPTAKKHGMKYPVLVGNDTVADGFGGVFAFPMTFVVGKDWKIYKKYMGALPNKHELIKRDIEKLLGEQTPAD